MKRCFRCGEMKPRSEYTKRRTSLDGLEGSCRSCVRLAKRASIERSDAQAIAAGFWPRVLLKANDCWEWQGSRFRNGYGEATGFGHRRAHAVAYVLAYGPLPEGLVIDHMCRNRACVRPDHLEAVTQRENLLRGERANRSHCPQGHPKTEENAYWNYRGERQCRPCMREQRKRYYAKARQEGRR